MRAEENVQKRLSVNRDGVDPHWFSTMLILELSYMGPLLLALEVKSEQPKETYPC